ADRFESGDDAAAEGRASATPCVLLAGGQTAHMRGVRSQLEPHCRVEILSAGEVASSRQSATAVLCLGSAGLELLREVRRVRPLLPAIAAVPEDAARLLVDEFAAEPIVVLREKARPEEIASVVRALLDASARSGVEPPPAWAPSLEPRSYAQLAGLLPRALARTIAFD